jgi:hypothetical protein
VTADVLRDAGGETGCAHGRLAAGWINELGPGAAARPSMQAGAGPTRSG